MTTLKARQPLSEINQVNPSDDDNMTVEKFLEKQIQSILEDFKAHSAGLIADLRQEYDEGVQSIKDMMDKNSSEEKNICVTLKVMAGPHIGQKFRLEPTKGGDDVFKVGRSTGKLFKEKGVSLYKDKEVSTTHAKFEYRNGQVFFLDARSTNGSMLNNEPVEPLTPLRLKDGDVVGLGSTELVVRISNMEGADPIGDENIQDSY
mmetsp:Transcript_30943/g.52321  ORF Transcript_30943/g.52321 Transcript_30943/m.52321 type:complete len:204 (+) Transcript_30943:93-704(+)|eukprot:CAMPEP_0174961962 /NCGR_PEP_ID=MMETSP0004_2-20121128/4522_1 /TAXON_ID=420556 /ORGANISM="Ochromonas sp., Strain CCMP1393" /LENGTH=203 /DNA_ID=CAMNT_0016210447 /DNA_START=74 /DNA_END=685 /DNA_ORIENTATION=-